MTDLYQAIINAREQIAPHVFHTSLEASQYLSDKLHANILLKNEHCQRTGSFKIRGAMNKLMSLNAQERAKGVVCASAGNHGIGVALAGQITNTQTIAFVPKTVDSSRLQQIKAYGAQVQLIDGDCGDAERQARAYAEKNRMVYVSPYNDYQVIAGQGTIGYEMHQDCPDLDYCFVAVGGGGLISGISCFLKEHNPSIKVIGCLPQNASIMAESVKRGSVVTQPDLPTLSDSTAGSLEADTITLSLCQHYVDDFVLVSEQEIQAAMRFLATEHHWMVEGAAGVALAGLIQMGKNLKAQKAAAVLCGRNINFEKYLQVMKSSG